MFDVHPRSRIWVSDPGVKIAQDPGSGSTTLSFGTSQFSISKVSTVPVLHNTCKYGNLQQCNKFNNKKGPPSALQGRWRASVMYHAMRWPWHWRCSVRVRAWADHSRTWAGPPPHPRPAEDSGPDPSPHPASSGCQSLKTNKNCTRNAVQGGAIDSGSIVRSDPHHRKNPFRCLSHKYPVPYVPVYNSQGKLWCCSNKRYHL